jgi:hypothetical protein
VRKDSLRLLQAIMLHNPFGPKLPVDRFEASLATHRAMLDQLVPPGGEEMRPLRVEGGEAQAEAAGEAAAEGTGAVKAEPGAAAGAEEMDVDGEQAPSAEVVAEDGEQEEEATQPARSRECWCRPVHVQPLRLVPQPAALTSQHTCLAA